jgi:hypothetical protein
MQPTRKRTPISIRVAPERRARTPPPAQRGRAQIGISLLTEAVRYPAFGASARRPRG